MTLARIRASDADRLTGARRLWRGVACAALAACLPVFLLARAGNAGQVETVAVARGGVFHLHSESAQPLLLAFVQMVPDTSNTASRRQAVFIQSMADQYSARGLRVALVDASRIADGKPAGHDELVNASYDWHLTIPVLEDDGALAKQFGVEQIPTTLLLTGDGTVSHRWMGNVAPGELAQQIERLVGG